MFKLKTQNLKLKTLLLAFALLTAALPAWAAPGDITRVAGNGTEGYSGDDSAATSANLYKPSGVAVAASGNIYIADTWNNRIRKVDTSGTITTLAGNGTQGYFGDGGAATSANLYKPSGVAVDASGNIYIADSESYRIRKVNTSGIITTVAGSGISGYSGDGGAATAAKLGYPSGVAVDVSGNIYISDLWNHRIRKVNTSGIIVTVAGNGTEGYSGDGGAATSATLSFPSGVAVDTSGNVYIADTWNGRIRKVNTSGTITTVADNGITPSGIFVDSAGYANIYIAEQYNNRIRKIDPMGTITTVAGSGTAGYSGDGGAATSATLSFPSGVAVDISGNIYIADQNNHSIRKVEGPAPDTTLPTGSISINSDASYTNSTSATLTLSCTDAGGCAEMRFSNDNTNWSSVEVYSVSKTWTMTSGDGAKTVYVKFKDIAGNWSTVYSDTIVLDTILPTGSLSINSGAASSNASSVMLTISCTDSSGCSQMRFSNNNSTWSSWEAYSTSKAWTLDTGNGTKTVSVQLSDSAGNLAVYSDTIVLDAIAPAVTARFLDAWTSRTSGETYYSLNDIAWSGSQFVVVGDGRVILTSPDGVTWTRQSSKESSYQGIVWSGIQFVAVGLSGPDSIITSPDGVTWTSRSSGNLLNDIAWSGSQFVAVGDIGTILTSPDGVTWTSRTSGTTDGLYSIIWSGIQFVAVGGGTAGSPILTSPDGITWTSRISGTAYPLLSVTWSGSQFVAVGSDGKILTSPDGITWTSRASGTTQTLRGITWFGSQFVAVGYNGTILTSPDGIIWTSRASGTTLALRGISCSGREFVVVGDNGTILSTTTSFTTEAVDAARNLANLYQRAIAVEKTTNRPHIVYGGDHLYHAYHNGTQWQYEVIDSLSSVGEYASIAIDSSSKVHVSYYDAAYGDLKYATNASGSWVTTTVDSTGDVGLYSSIAIDSNNKVHISYFDNSYPNYRLKYATNSSSSWTFSDIDNAGYVGTYTSIAIDSNNRVHISYSYASLESSSLSGVKYATNAGGSWTTSIIDWNRAIYSSIAADSNGKAHISYYDAVNSDLKYATNLSGSWVATTVDSGGTVGLYTSIALDSNGKAHISCYDSTNGDLKYATNTSGYWTTSPVDSAGNVGLYTSIAADSNNKMHISYLDSTNSDLKYATNASDSWAISTVDGTGYVQDTAIDIDSGNKAHISYYDSTDSDLKYITNTSGAWVTTTIDSTGNVGRYASIALDSNGKAYISYYDSTNGDLKYATNSSGSWVTTTVDSTGDVGQYASIVLDSFGKAHISYYDATSFDLKYATNSSGSWVATTIDSAGSVGQYTSIALDSNGKIYISYYDAANTDLKYATNISGSWVATIIDSTGNVGQYTSIALDSNGKSYISYYDATNGDLKYATNLSGSWVTTTVDGTGNVGQYTSIDLDSNGRAHISYYGTTSADLKYATNASGSWVATTIDSTGDVGQYTSIVLDSNNRAHIVCSDNTNRDLKYVNTTYSSGSVIINTGATYTKSTSVSLTLSCTAVAGCTEMKFSNDNFRWSEAMAYAASRAWTLASGEGMKTVYVKFKDNAGNWSGAYSDSIILDTYTPYTTFSPAGGTYLVKQWVALSANEPATIYYTTDGTTPTTASSVYSSPILVDSSKTIRAFAVDAAGNGWISESYYTINILPSATGQTGSAGDDVPTGIAADGSGNVYVTGYTYGGMDGVNAGLTDIFLTKYNSSGVEQWTRQLGTTGYDEAKGVAIDGNGDAYITGYTDGGLDGNTNSGGTDSFLIKYNSSGAKQWTMQIGSSGDDIALGVAIDVSSIYITGYTYGGLDGNANAGNADVFLTKYDSSGVKQWTRQLGTTGRDEAKGVAIDGNGDAYITGYTYGGLDGNTNAGNADVFLTKYDSSGVKQWTKQYGTEYDDYAYSVSNNAYGIYVAGHAYSFAASLNQNFLINYNSSGSKVWDKQLGTDYYGYVSIDANGNVYAIGGDPVGYANAGSTEILLTKYNSLGVKQWTRQFGSAGSDAAYAVIANANGVYVTGTTTGGLNGNINAGGSDIFLIKLPESGGSDTIPPVGSVTINAGADTANTTSVTLTLSAVDNNVTVSQMRFSNDYGGSWSSWVSYTTTKQWNLSSGDGWKWVYAQFKDAAGNVSDQYIYDSINLETGPPSAPSNIYVENKGAKGQLEVSWSNPGDGDFSHIHIYRSMIQNLPGDLIVDNLWGTKYTDIGLESLTTYYYTVKAVDWTGNESVNTIQYSAKTSDATPPGVPEGAAATDATTGGAINISWTNPSDTDLAKIIVYRSTTSGTLGNTQACITLSPVIGASAGCSNTGLTNGTTYYYTVRAVDSSGNETANTIQVSAIPTKNGDATPPAYPPSVTVTDQHDGSLLVSWSWGATVKDIDLEYLRIYRSMSAGTLGTLVLDRVSKNDTSAIDSGLVIDTTYYYTIRAMDTSGNESANINQATSPCQGASYGCGSPTDTQAPKPVSNLAATLLSDRRVKLDWIRSSSTDINYYNIYWNGGSGEINYATRLERIQHPATTWTSPILTASNTYLFAVRAEDEPGNVETNTTVVVSVAPVDDPTNSGVKAYIKAPLAGQKISGGAGSVVTVSAELLAGNKTGVGTVQFKYRPASGGSWTEITSAVTVYPWYVSWDVSALTPGDYQVTAVATSTGSATDSNPSYTTVTIDNSTFEAREYLNASSEPVKEQEVSPNATNKVAVGSASGVIDITIPEGALTSDTQVTATVKDPDTVSLPSGYKTGAVFLEINLQNAQTTFENNKKAEIVLPYKDDNNDGVVDGTTTKVYDLKVMWFNTTAGTWEKLDSWLDNANKVVRASTTHFSLFGLMAPPNPTTSGWNLVSVPLYPSPNSVSSVFGQTAYVYNPTTNSYYKPSTVSPGIGYWIKGGTNLTASGTETPTTDSFSISIKKGWNMIGNPFRFKVKLSDMKINYNAVEYAMANAEANSIVVGTAFPYVNGVYQYVNASDDGVIEPWVGYWILSYEDCTLLVPPTPAQ